MLDYLLPIEWSEGVDDKPVGRPAAALPPGFDLLPRPGSNPIANGWRSGNAIRLQLPWVFGRSGAIVLDAPVEYDFTAAAFCIDARDVDATRRLVATARCGDLVALKRQSTGCLGQLDHRQISEAFLADAGPRFTELRRDPGNRVWIGSGGEAGAAERLPTGFAFHSDALPPTMTLTVEATTACNFRCSFCYGRHLKQGVLRAAQFLQMLDHVLGIAAVEFTGEGETLLNRDAMSMMRLCKQRGLWVHLTTNGSRMTRDRAVELVDLGLDSFAVSLESTDPDEYARLRPGGRLQTLEDTIARMRSAMNERGRRVELRLWVSLTRDSLAQVDGFLEYADRHGFDRVEFQTLNSLPAYARFYPEPLRAQIPTRADIVVASSQPGLSDRGRQALAGLIFDARTCHRFMHALAPSWQGLLLPCCQLKIPDFAPFGDLTKTPLVDLWADDEFRRFRFASQHGVVLASCDGCADIAASGRSFATENEDVVEKPAHFAAITRKEL